VLRTGAREDRLQPSAGLLLRGLFPSSSRCFNETRPPLFVRRGLDLLIGHRTGSRDLAVDAKTTAACPAACVVDAGGSGLAVSGRRRKQRSLP
jgi:hypothetical protein